LVKSHRYPRMVLLDTAVALSVTSTKSPFG
jgi:hypothetical protein